MYLLLTTYFLCSLRTPLLHIAYHSLLMQGPTYILYMPETSCNQVATNSPMYCVCSRSVYLHVYISQIDQLGHTSHSVWLRILSLGHRLQQKQHYVLTGCLILASSSTHNIQFLDTFGMFQQKLSHLCMAFLCCSHEWSVGPLHIK